MKLAGRLVAVVGVLALCLGALGLGYVVRSALPGVAVHPAAAQDADDDAATPDEDTTTPADPDDAAEQPNEAGEEPAPEEAVPEAPPVEAIARMVTDKGVIHGQVLIGELVVIETQDELGGLGPYERASIAAARINLAVQEGARPEDFKTVQRGGEWLVVARDRVIIGVSAGEARAQKTTAKDLADKWATETSMALYEALGAKPGESVPLPPVSVEPKAIMVEGVEAGALMMNDQEVLRITTPAPGLTPYQRAEIVADRLKQAIGEGALPQDVQASSLYGMAVVKVGETLLITVDEQAATNAGKTSQALAGEWAGTLSGAIGTHYAQASKPILATATEWKPAEPYDDKWVPIISLLEGIKLGLARVNGPRSAVRTVQAVAQLETHWKDYVEIDVYVPISTKVPGEKLAVVKACAVTGLGDIKL